MITGTYRWEIGGQGNGEFASVGSVAVDAYGQGLKLLGCNGPMHASNGKAAWHTPHAFDVTKGHTTCRWRARFGTGWSTDLGLVVAAGGGTYKAGDYYAVDNKQTALEGTIRFRNDRNSPPTSLGVPGAKVHISGPGGQYNAAANSDGYWYVLVNRGGSFKVDPVIPRKYQIGRNYVTPTVAHVSVPSGGVGKAEFEVKDPLKVTLTLSKSSVVANGADVGIAKQGIQAADPSAVVKELVTGTVKVTKAGAPVPSFQVAILPFEGKALSLARFPVLARICGSAITWPTFTGADANNTIDAYTDSTGVVQFSIIVGTTPGSLAIEVRPTDQSSTTLQDVDLGRVDPIETLHITPVSSQGTIAGGMKADLRQFGYLMGSTTTWSAQMSRMAASGELGDFNVAPVRRNFGPGSGAVLVYPAGTRIQLSPTDSSLLSAPSGSFVIEPDLWVGKPPLGQSFDAAARGGFIAAFPTLQQWLSGGTVPGGGSGDWNLGAPPTTPGIAYSTDYQGYSFGFGYQGAGGC